MKVLVYEVLACYEVDIEGEDHALVMRDAIARVERGEVKPMPNEVKHLAFPARSKVEPADTRTLLRKLIQATPEQRVQAARQAGVFDEGDPATPNEWLAAVVRRAVTKGCVAGLMAALG